MRREVVLEERGMLEMDLEQIVGFVEFERMLRNFHAS